MIASESVRREIPVGLPERERRTRKLSRSAQEEEGDLRRRRHPWCRVSSTTAVVVALVMIATGMSSVHAFVIQSRSNAASATTATATISRPSAIASTTTTSLFALGVLAKKAKQAELRKYVQEVGVEESVMQVYQQIQRALQGDEDSGEVNSAPGPLQQALTRRKGTITVIAEYKRKNDQCESGYIGDVYDPELLSPVFREYGCSGIAVLADERMGGCTYDDLKAFVEEQRRARNEVPGPVLVINSDLVVDELQVARTAACGASACVVTLSVVGAETLPTLLRACRAANVEAVVAVSTPDEAQQAVNAGARILSVVAVDGVDDKVNVVANLQIPDGQQVCKIANIIAKNDKQLQEIEEAWALRDKGFQCAWVSDALYKGGADAIEHPGAIIRSMKSKSSLKWASPKAYSGKGEGAREYLGDILM